MARFFITKNKAGDACLAVAQIKSRLRLVDADLLLVLADALELDLAADHGEKGIVGASADVHAGMDLGASLADEDVAREDVLAVAALRAEALGVGISAVLGGAHSLFMSEKLYS